VTIETLLSESPAAARRREREAFEKLAGIAHDKIVLVGAGNLGRKVLAGLRSYGIEPLIFTDTSAGLQQTVVGGLEVVSPAEAAARYAEEAVFVVTNFRGAGDRGMAAREAQLRTLGCKRVTSFIPLAWRYSEALLPHYGAALPSQILGAADDLRAINAFWNDAASRSVFHGQLLWRLRGDFTSLCPPAADQYFPRELFALRPEDIVVDGGAFDGDTLRTLGPNFARAWAIEPDPANAARLRARVDSRVTVIEAALGAARGRTRLFAERGVASAVSSEGNLGVLVETLDALLQGERVTFIKLDVEGSEHATLEGARCLLARSQPIVAVCIYHRPEDLWELPRFLREALPAHRLFLRAHENDGYELVAYAVPPERLCLSNRAAILGS